MRFRIATQADLEEVARTSISRGLKEFPVSIDHVYTLEHNGHVLGVGGIKLLTPTTAWAWFDLAAESKQYMTVVYRVIRDWLDAMIHDFDLHRVMAAVDPTFAEAVRTVEHLGFLPESRMPRFFGDNEGVLYVKFAENDHGRTPAGPNP